MDKKIRASILGNDINLLKNVAKRVAENRPVDVKYYTEVKEFLMDSMNERPDIAAISVNYPHKNAHKFPTVFKMALNIPVIVFGENQETKTRKNLSISKADFKISGVLTAHNFWMKLINFKKQQEREKKVLSQKIETSSQDVVNISSEIESVDHFDSLNKQLDKSLEHINKGDFEKILEQDENLIIDSLFAQIGGDKAGSNFKHIRGDNIIPVAQGESADKSNISLIENTPSTDESENEKGSFASDKELLKHEQTEEKGKEKEKKPELATQKNKENNSNNEEGVKSPDIDDKGRVKVTGKKELQKREQEKYREKRKKDTEKGQNVLKECCQKSLEKTLFTKKLEEPREFSSTQLSVFTIEAEAFKGFILISESFNQGFEKSTLENLRSSIIDHIKSKGYVAELSSPYSITIPESNYTEVVKSSCEFTVYEEEETGKQIALSFIQREVIQPQYEDSDKDGMITVDMQTIPPQTPVNFDAFIYLPRNKRFVRYLKEGRSLSLKQVKKNVTNSAPRKLYLPKADKGKLIQFFIQNTIGWEFISHSPEEKESA